jgi:hypothetical protein
MKSLREEIFEAAYDQAEEIYHENICKIEGAAKLKHRYFVDMTDMAVVYLMCWNAVCREITDS